MKTCSVCRVEKLASEFNRDKKRADGLQCTCRMCAKGRIAAWRAANPEKVKAQQRHYHEVNREVLTAKMRARYYADVEAARARVREWAARDPERAQSAQRLSKKKRYAADPVRVLAANKARRVARDQRLPPWADLDAIEAVYRKAARIAELTGEPVHVDHDIPLRGKLVSGLHVANNLVIRHAVENLRKSNHFEVV